MISSPSPAVAGPAQPAPLQLVFRARGGRTYLASHAARNPLKVVRPFALSDGGALMQVLLNAPGLFAGDDYVVQIVVERGARALGTATGRAPRASLKLY